MEARAEASLFLREFDREASEMCNRVANAEWKYATNATDYNKRRMREQQSVASKFECLSWRRAHSINSSIMVEPNLRRQFDRILKQGHCGLGDVKFLEYNHVLSIMKDTYNNAKICPYNGEENKLLPHAVPNNARSANYVRSSTQFCDLKLDPDIIKYINLYQIYK